MTRWERIVLYYAGFCVFLGNAGEAAVRVTGEVDGIFPSWVYLISALLMLAASVVCFVNLFRAGRKP